MFLGFMFRIIVSATILLAATHIVKRKGAKPEFLDVFYVALGIALVSTLLTLILFSRIGYFVLIPIFAANILILMRYLTLSVIQAVIVLILYQVISYFLPF